MAGVPVPCADCGGSGRFVVPATASEGPVETEYMCGRCYGTGREEVTS